MNNRELAKLLAAENESKRAQAAADRSNSDSDDQWAQSAWDVYADLCYDYDVCSFYGCVTVSDGYTLCEDHKEYDR